jgi:flagellar biosynthesis GTPase FlhF
MVTANPSYDTVFKFLMEDMVSAKLILSIILNCNIVELVLLPQEVSKARDSKGRKGKKSTSLTLLRLDFSAIILTETGERKHVIIEIQKAKVGSHIIRFRQYLGAQYRDENNVERVTVNNRLVKKAIPMVSIYFIGTKLKHTKASIIGVSRQYTDLLTGEVILQKEDFIEALSHDMYVIQIPYLTQNKESDLGLLLNLFDQNTVTEPKGHFMNVREADFPPPFHHLVNRLHMAAQTAQIIEKMEAEDQMIAEYDELEEELEKALLQVAKASRQVDAERKQREAAQHDAKEERRQKEEAQKQKEEAQKQKEEAQKQKEEAQSQKEEAQQSLVVMVKFLHQSMTVTDIAVMLKKPETEIAALLEK